MEPQTTNEALEHDDDALNTKEAARFLGSSVSRLARLRVTGGGCVFIKDGASVRYLRSDLRLSRCPQADVDQRRAHETAKTSAERSLAPPRRSSNPASPAMQPPDAPAQTIARIQKNKRESVVVALMSSKASPSSIFGN